MAQGSSNTQGDGRHVPLSLYKKNVILIGESDNTPVAVTLPDDLVAFVDNVTKIKPTIGATVSLTEFEFEAGPWPTTTGAQKTATVAPAHIDTGGAVKLGTVNAQQFTITPGVYRVEIAVQTDAATAKKVEISVDGENGGALITQNSMLLPGDGNKVALARTLRFGGDDGIAGTLALKVYCPAPSAGMLVGGEITFTKVG